MAEYYEHLQDIALFIPDLYDNAGMKLLIIMVIVYAEHMLDQRVGEKGLSCSQT